ncbi:2Fe-2S iron-sulfur cluster binding domain-containing protein [Oceanispirochaeta crateris]|uniref:2Fe-2S iron-sulfur cluster binding domain-containing protein n=1 Tax=Oceanispirochaeta crateris TaxID=2518645 RepID=A0A5C1QL31_9SPIO|nr:molybdopterin cofactor-binding domain-containing protein [Oceanispirochaeta crateris]QEN07314.1 2Fe-2S iron-sulfur cluster binding domain-containing protein [Oceanispirochaeta crateris]
MSSNTINFTVNGSKVSLNEKPGEMLSELLRYRLGLTGTKVGCNESECGSCTVLIDGEPVLSCSYPAAKVSGHEVLTIEGLAMKKPDSGCSCGGSCKNSGEPGKKQDETENSERYTPSDSASGHLHPLQDAFVQYGAVQCGFCIPGQLMTSFALLTRNPDPSTDEIKEALKDTLCRCAGYPSIIKAVKAAGKAMRTGTQVEPPADIPTSLIPHKAVGTLKPRMDGADKVTGQAHYTDDLSFDGMLHARVKRAMVPSAILKSLDISRALALPGVEAVLTASDIPGKPNHGVIYKDWPILVAEGGKVRTVGDAIAIVAAVSRETATEALDLITMEFEELPVIDNPVQAAEPGAPKVHDQGNLLKHIEVRKGQMDKGFNQADVLLEHTFRTPSHDHAFIEPECSIARLTSDGRMEIYVGSQIPYEDRQQVAEALGIQESQVRVRGQLIGGGFGGKEDIAGQIHAALLAQVTKKPVKLLFDRHESLIVHPKRHATIIKIRMGASKDGKLTAVDTQLYGDTGAYASLGDKVMTRATTHSSGPYDVPHVKADCFAMYTNNPPAGAFRGFGVLQSAFAVESAMDMLAEKLHIDPLELRKINALREGSATNTGQILGSSVGLLECIEKVEEKIKALSGDDPFVPKADPHAPHLVTAWGIAVAYKNTGLGGGAPDKGSAEIELYNNGIFEVRTSSAELGQGLPTVLQLIAAEELSVSPETIKVLLSDTDLTPDGGPTTASRQTYVAGNSTRQTAIAFRNLIIEVLSEQYGVPSESVTFANGQAVVKNKKLTMKEVAEELRKAGRPNRVQTEYMAPETSPLGEGGDMHFGFSFAAQATEIMVNKKTGEIEVLRLITATDVGAAINPLGLRGQIEGGAMMGISHALLEEFIVDKGHVVTDRLARYRIAPITMTPEIIPIVVEHGIDSGPYGGKGVGEIVTIPTSPAIANALYNATGVRVDRIPIDQEYVLKKIGELKSSKS